MRTKRSNKYRLARKRRLFQPLDKRLFQLNLILHQTNVNARPARTQRTAYQQLFLVVFLWHGRRAGPRAPRCVDRFAEILGQRLIREMKFFAYRHTRVVKQKKKWMWLSSKNESKQMMLTVEQTIGGGVNERVRQLLIHHCTIDETKQFRFIIDRNKSNSIGNIQLFLNINIFNKNNN